MSVALEDHGDNAPRALGFGLVFGVSLAGLCVLLVWIFWLIEEQKAAALLSFVAVFLTVASFFLGNTYSLKEYRTQLGRQIRIGRIAEHNVSRMPSRGFLIGRLKVLKGAVLLGAIAVVGAVVIVNRTDDDAWVVGMVVLLLAILVGGVATFSQPMGTVKLESLEK